MFTSVTFCSYFVYKRILFIICLRNSNFYYAKLKLNSQSEFDSGRRARSRRANQAATPRPVKLITSVHSDTVSRCCITCVSLIRFAKPTEQSRAVSTMPTMISCFIWLLILSRLGVATLSLRKLSSLHPKPTCEPHEPCRIGFLGMEFCTCPGDRKCPHSSESSLFYQDVEYHFCDEAKFHICEEGEVAWVKKGLHQIVNCICPEPFVLHGELWNPAEDMSQYKCLPKKYCYDNDTCMIRNRVFIGEKTISLVKGFCTCPAGMGCVETGEMIKNRLIELEQDIFKCRQVA